MEYPPCSGAGDFLHIDQFVSISFTFAAVSIPCNLLGVYCILQKSSPKVRNYKWVLLSYQIWMLSLDGFMTLLAAPAFYFPSLSGSVSGLLSRVGVPVVYQLYVGIAISTSSAVSLQQLFEYRHQCIVSHDSFFKKKNAKLRFIVNVAHYFVYGVVLMPIVYYRPEDQTASKLLAVQRLGCVPHNFFSERAMILGNGEDSTPVVTLILLLSVYLIECLVYIMHSVWCLIVDTAHLSEYTRKLQARFLVVLFAQMCLPVILLLLPILYYLLSVVFNRYNPPLHLAFELLVVLHGFSSGVSLIFFDSRYNRFVSQTAKSFVFCAVHCKRYRSSNVVHMDPSGRLDRHAQVVMNSSASLAAHLPACDGPDDFLGVDGFIFITHALSAVAIPTNFFGIYCILSQTSPKVRNYKWLLLNYQLWVVTSDAVLSFLIAPLLYLPALSGCGFGLLTTIGVPMIFQAYLGIVVVCQCVTAVVQLFEYRHQCIVSHNSIFKYHNINVRAAVIGTHYVFSAVFLLPLLVSAPTDQPTARICVAQMLQCVPPHLFTSCSVVLQTNDDPMFPAIAGAAILVYIIETAFYIFHGGWSLLRNNAHMSTYTRKLQTRFFVGLCAQVSGPVITLVVPAIYFLQTFFTSFYSTQYSMLGTLLLMTHGFVSTISLISFDITYRRFVKKCIYAVAYRVTCRKPPQRPRNSMQTSFISKRAPTTL